MGGLIPVGRNMGGGSCHSPILNMYRCNRCNKIIKENQVSSHTRKHMNQDENEGLARSPVQYSQPVRFMPFDLIRNPIWTIKHKLKKL